MFLHWSFEPLLWPDWILVLLTISRCTFQPRFLAAPHRTVTIVRE